MSSNPVKLNYAKLLWTRKHPIVDHDTWFGKFGKVKRAKLRILFNNQSGECIYCGKQCQLPEDFPTVPRSHKATTEHIIPASQGGGAGLRNLAMSCYPCNSRRGIIPHEVFLAASKEGKLQALFPKIPNPIYTPIKEDLLEMAKLEIFGPTEKSRPGRVKRAGKIERIQSRNASVLYMAILMTKSPEIDLLAQVINEYTETQRISA